MKPLNLRFN